MPVVLIATMYVIFQTFTVTFGFPLGYLLAFVVYWVVWCGVVPMAVIGRRSVCNLFAAGDAGFVRLGVTTHALLWWPILFPLVFVFVPRVTSAGWSMIL